MTTLSVRKILFILVLACTLVGFALYAISVGTLSVSHHKIFAMIFGSAHDILDLENFVVFEVRILRIIASIVVGGSLALSGALYQGIIGWVGLVIPHIARFIIGANHRFMLPFCALFGALFLLFCDSLARGLLSTEIPLGILTSIFGIPVFVVILYINKRAVNE